LIRFILASASPARLATLRAAGVEPEVIVSGFDEDSIRASSVSTLVEKLAGVKALTVRQGITGDALVLGCDSLLELDGEPLGKPKSPEDAVARWRRMRGHHGVLWTGHSLIDTVSGRTTIGVVPTRVHFGQITDDEIDAYVGTGEPANVAGAFTIDGLGGWFIDAIEGDHHNVVGLSLPTLRTMLHELGYSLADIGYPRS
jgi:septum formation protein